MVIRAGQVKAGSATAIKASKTGRLRG